MSYGQLSTIKQEPGDETEESEQKLDSGTYKGNWLYNRRHGEGTMLWSDGSEFEGTWHNDKRYKGTMRMTDGTVYSGEWKEGEELHGLGRIIYPDGLIFEGQF